MLLQGEEEMFMDVATSPLQCDHEYDLPTGPHVGPAAALRVPCSQGPASSVFDRGETPDTTLIEREPEEFQRASALAPGGSHQGASAGR